jgi:hypothetical protein
LLPNRKPDGLIIDCVAIFYDFFYLPIYGGSLIFRGGSIRITLW